MKKPSYDPGLTQQYSPKLRRAIRKDGEFNVRRHGTTWQDIHPYLYFINKSWPTFFGLMFASFIAVNLLFAMTYYCIGVEHLQGAAAPTAWGRFLNAFFFSSQTLTTVGYGVLAPKGVLVNLIASFEAMIGLMGFAIATGFLVGRVSRPSARMGFSKSMIIAPYQDGTSLQFRVVNRSMSNLMELEASVMLMTVETVDGQLRRKFDRLELEREGVLFLALTWTIVHPIGSDSPLFGKTAADLERMQAEVLILIKGMDDTFSQIVHARYSYRYDEIVWGAKFAPAFEIDKKGSIRLEVDRVSDFIKVPPLDQ
ncbi:MAG TPA: ion channel [Terriglobia bacterium]|nr:ion channel [Terriglobia bacterium]